MTPPAPAAPEPLTFRTSNRYARVSLTLPPALQAWPALRGALYESERRSLVEFADGARDAHADMGDPPGGERPYTKTIDYAWAGETARLVSLKKTTYEYTGGAHPNGAIDGVIWDKAAGARLDVKDLIRPDADTAALDRALCEAVKAAKRERTGSDALMDGGCPTFRDGHAVLVRSAGGKAAGLRFLYSPYEVGSYAEGAYEVVLPARVFRSALRPEFASEFSSAG